MSKQSHTPGPWAIIPRDETPGHREPIMVNTGNGLWSPLGDRNPEPNAHLIAAAPDLLHALIMVRDADNDCHKDGLQTIPPVARHCIDAAIAKAEGGAS